MKPKFLESGKEVYVEIGRGLVAHLRHNYEQKYCFVSLSNYPLSSDQLTDIVKKMEELNGA